MSRSSRRLRKIRRKAERRQRRGRGKTSRQPKNDLKHRIKVEQDYICPLCGEKGTDSSMNIHHKKPKSRGGTNERSNLVAWHIWGHRKYHQENGLRECDDYGNPL